jgi:hypothetical protein
VSAQATNPGGAAGHVGIGVDVTNANSGTSTEEPVGQTGGIFSMWRGYPGLGWHSIYALEHRQASGNVTFMGDNGFGSAAYQCGLAYETRY